MKILIATKNNSKFEIISRMFYSILGNNILIKNLNNYDKEFLKSKKYVENKIKIENIYEYMNANSKKEEIKIILKEFEEIINAKGKI